MHNSRDSTAWRWVPAANKATFLGWLRSQRTRDDPVGDIARDEESHRFIEPTSFKHLTRQLREAIHPLCTWVPDGSPIWAAWQAWREYRRGGKPTLPIKQLRVHNKKDEHGIDHETTMVWKLGRIWKRGRIRGCSRVYFLRDGDHIKIGTSTDVTSRMAGGQTMNPRELVLIGSVLGDRKLEVDLHRKFKNLHVRGEWFEATPELLAFIDGLLYAAGASRSP